MKRQVRMRLAWVELFEATGDAGFVCRRCGISRPTLRKWVRRHRADGLAGLEDRSRRPASSPGSKVGVEEEARILDLRRQRNLGARRIQNELRRLSDIRLSLATIHKVLTRNRVEPLAVPKRKRPFKRYEREIPGERVQMDTMKIRPALYQYTAVDDCTRYQVLGLFDRRTAANTISFLDQTLEEMPFPIQRIQTDRGREFFAYKVQQQLMDLGIKFRPVRPRSAHLNGKVERAQKTVLQEFWTTVDPDDKDLAERLAQWQHEFNWHRSHGALNGRTPMDRYFELSDKTPFSDEVLEGYEPSKEWLRVVDYDADLALQRLKRSL